jgi:hypothetical protein
MSPESAWPGQPSSSRTERVEDEMVRGDDRKQRRENVEAQNGCGVRSINSAGCVVSDHGEQPQTRYSGKEQSACRRQLEC